MMEFFDFPLPSNIPAFPSQANILKYLHDYAEHFDLKRHIKFNHEVVRVQPLQDDRWHISVHDLLNEKLLTNIYDTVFVCNGHFFEPSIPKTEGAETFKGKLFHSHDFRSADHFKGML